jgi:hypothetical protein
VRLVPTMFVLMLTVARVDARQKALAAIAGLLFVVWMINITRNFVLLQDDVAPMVTAIRMLPRNARMLPIIDVDESDDLLHRFYTHFWAYAIVERGALAPYIFDRRGQNEVRIHEEGYIPDAPEEFPPRLGTNPQELRLRLDLGHRLFEAVAGLRDRGLSLRAAATVATEAYLRGARQALIGIRQPILRSQRVLAKRWATQSCC